MAELKEWEDFSLPDDPARFCEENRKSDPLQTAADTLCDLAVNGNSHQVRLAAAIELLKIPAIKAAIGA